jgi:hypothetical protein
LFSIGNVKPLFQATFPNCWKTFKTCSSTWIACIDYLEVSGIIVGEFASLNLSPKIVLTGSRPDSRRSSW